MMNGLGLQEILVIATVIIIFVRPSELPLIFRKAGKIWAKVYYYYTMIKKELRSMEKRDRHRRGDERDPGHQCKNEK